MDVVTGERLEQSQSELWNAMKTWVLQNIDNSNIMSIVKQTLDSANRAVIGTTGTAKADAILSAVNDMVAAFQDAGLSMTGITTAQFAEYIRVLSEQTGVVIEDSNNRQWTAEQWTRYHTTEVAKGILLKKPDGNMLIATTDYEPVKYGTYQHTVPSLEGSAIDVPKNGKTNTRRTMAATNPDHCLESRKATYTSTLDTTDLTDKDVCFFPDEATLTAWAAAMGQAKMSALGSAILYVYPHASYTAENHYYVLKYWNGSAIAQREAIVPYTDTSTTIGCLPVELAYLHREYAGDTTEWYVPSMWEGLMIVLNKTAINACRTALGNPVLPSASIWTCVQYNDGLQYYISLVDGTCLNTYKYYAHRVLLVAS